MFKANEEDIDKRKKLLTVCTTNTMEIYTTYGFIEEAKMDLDSEVRRMAYDMFGWDESAKLDSDDYNRCIAYRILGFKNEFDIATDESDEEILFMYFSKFPIKSYDYNKLKSTSIINRVLYLLNKTKEELEEENIGGYWVNTYFKNKEVFDTIIKMLESDNMNDVVFQMKNTDDNIKNIVKIKMYDHLINRNKK
jgi:hypothetical protein